MVFYGLVGGFVGIICFIITVILDRFLDSIELRQFVKESQ